MLSRRLFSSIAAFIFICLLATTASLADQRKPIPSAVDLINAETQIKDLFKDELTRVRAGERIALARTMLKDVDTVNSDMAARYELYIYARMLAAKAGDAALALEAADGLCKEFAVRPGQAHATVVELSLNVPPPTADAARESVDAYLGAVDGAVASDEFDAALTLARAAETAARKTGTMSSVLSAQQKIKWINALKPEAEKVKASLATLEKNPSDPAANLAVGRFYCFVKNDWEHGLGYLSLGSDTGLKDTALRDMMAAKSNIGSELVAVADAWYGIATASDAISRPFIQMHAYDLYTKAVPALAGLEKAKAEKRATELQKIVDAHTDNSKFWSVIRKAVASKSIKRWDFIGGGFARQEFDEIPPAGAVLIGFNFSTQGRGQYPGVIQAIYLTPSGEALGHYFGKLERGARLFSTKAKPGYAVGAIYVRGGGGFDAFQPIYMRIGPDGFKAEDKYDGPYVGGQGGGDGIIGDGNFIVGIHTKVGDDGHCHSLSIATLTTASHTVKLSRVPR